MSFASRMRSVCPYLVPLDADGLLYDGFIVINGAEYRLKVMLPSSGELSKARLEGDLKLREIFSEISSTVQQRLNDSLSLPEFLLELQVILENKLMNNSLNASLSKPPKYYSLLIDELNAIGWHNDWRPEGQLFSLVDFYRLSHVDPLLNEVHVKVVDQGSREHILKLEFPDEYPEKAPRVNIDLPNPFEIDWTKEHGQTLDAILQQYELRLEHYQLLWNLLEDVDRQLWVLDPEQPRRSDVTRRVALGNSSSLIFTVDPLKPRMIPSWTFLGNDKVIEPLKEVLTCNLEHDWDENLSLVDNWRKLLPLEIPSRITNKKEDVQVECAICYSYRLDGRIPEICCDDDRCKQIFHAICIYDWLKSSSTSRQGYDKTTLFGECPFCSKAISCKTLSLLITDQ